MVHNYEVSEDPPHLFGNTTINLQSLHQGLAFLPRNVLDVRNVEVARAWRLTNNSVEPVSFTVPRVRVSCGAVIVKALVCESCPEEMWGCHSESPCV